MTFKGFTNKDCEFFPCHKIKTDFNCLFCYCPLLDRECPGPYKIFTSKYGKESKDCSDCTLPHDGIVKSWKFIQRWIPIALPWAGGTQNQERIKRNTKYVNERFDVSDLSWADDECSVCGEPEPCSHDFDKMHKELEYIGSIMGSKNESTTNN